MKQFRVTKTEVEWKAVLSPEEYRILRQEGTDPAYRNKYHDHFEPGIYKCAACGQHLFSSEHKFEACGWPSFTAPIEPGAIGTKLDNKFGMRRTEVHCAQCGGHLGHLFYDGPPPKRERY